MRRIRKWLVTAGVALALLLPLASVASADPDDGGFSTTSITTTTSTSKPGKTTGSYSATTLLDPDDGGSGP